MSDLLEIIRFHIRVLISTILPLGLFPPSIPNYVVPYEAVDPRTLYLLPLTSESYY
jgi:hypothetical protein